MRPFCCAQFDGRTRRDLRTREPAAIFTEMWPDGRAAGARLARHVPSIPPHAGLHGRIGDRHAAANRFPQRRRQVGRGCARDRPATTAVTTVLRSSISTGRRCPVLEQLCAEPFRSHAILPADLRSDLGTCRLRQELRRARCSPAKRGDQDGGKPMLNLRAALAIGALAATTSLAAAQQTTVTPASPPAPATTGTVVATPPPSTTTVAPAPGTAAAPAPTNSANPSAAPSGQNPAVDQGMRTPKP